MRAIDAFAKPGTELNKGLRAIKDADPTFDPKTFVDGAKMAYEMIVHGLCRRRPQDAEEPAVARGL